MKVIHRVEKEVTCNHCRSKLELEFDDVRFDDSGHIHGSFCVCSVCNKIIPLTFYTLPMAWKQRINREESGH